MVIKSALKSLRTGRGLVAFILTIATAGTAQVASVQTAAADSCWNHNGSVMRLQAQGNQRWFTYENPRAGIRQVGVTPGTLLFNGYNNNDYYSGTARVFSRGCGALEYYVEGPVTRPSGQIVITMTGSREVYNNCRPTGQWKQDRLVFTYMRNC